MLPAVELSLYIKKYIYKCLHTTFFLVINSIERRYWNIIFKYFSWEACSKSTKPMKLNAFFLNAGCLKAKNSVYDFTRLQQVFCCVPYQLFEANKWYLLAILDLKSHGYWSKLDYVTNSFTLYIFSIFKVIPRLYRPTIAALLPNLSYTQRRNDLQLFLQNIIQNRKS